MGDEVRRGGVIWGILVGRGAITRDEMRRRWNDVDVFVGKECVTMFSLKLNSENVLVSFEIRSLVMKNCVYLHIVPCFFGPWWGECF
jgi:hypothetical protein